jgi:O-antigen/teichoic acid export membrane protein
MVQRSDTNAWNSVPALIIGALLMLYFIPDYGILGCLIGYTFQFIVLLLTTFLTARHWIRIPTPWLDLLKIAIATAGMAGALLTLSPFTSHLPVAIDLAIRIGAGALTYAVIVFLLRPGPVLEYFPHRAAG